MAYTEGTTAATANPARDLALLLHTALLAAGFTYIEEVLGPTTRTTRVYKSAAADNGVGDWYLIVCRTSDAGTTLYFGVGEDYDVIGHLVKKWAPDMVTAGQTLPADRSHYTTAGTGPRLAAEHTSPRTVSTATTAHPYVFSLNPKRVVVATKAGTETGVYAGLYEPILPAAADHFPLMVSVLGAVTGAADTAYTREPGTGTTVATSGGAGTFTSGVPGSLWSRLGAAALSDGYAGKPSVVQLLVPPSQSKTGQRGSPYGLFGGDRAFAFGDLVNITWSGDVIATTCIYHSTTASRELLVDRAW